MSKRLIGEALSLAAECALPKIQADLQRRLVLGGMLGAASLLAARPLRAVAAGADRTIVSPDGIVRTTLESYINDAGEDFRLVLTTYPPGVCRFTIIPRWPITTFSRALPNPNMRAKTFSASRQVKATRTRRVSSTRSFAIRIAALHSDI